MSMINFKSRLNAILKEKNLTQTQLSLMCGKSSSWLSMIHKRNNLPSRRDIETIAKILQIDPSALISDGTISRGSMLPVLSWVQAGRWSETFETGNEIEEREVPFTALPPNCFLLQVRGDSMSRSPGRSYYDGMFIVVDPDCSKDPNDLNRKVVVARVREMATLKEFVLDGGMAYLKPWNTSYPVLQVTEEVEIIGLVIHCFE